MPVKNYESLNTTTDVTTTKTLLHEAIPVTGTIMSGVYGNWTSETNVKNYTHGMWQSQFDYPYLSSSANHIFDITMGFDESSTMSGSLNAVQQSKKINIYNQFSQVLLGYTGSTNTVRLFENDLVLDASAANLMKDGYFLSFSRLLTKDQIKKGSVNLKIGTGSWADPFASTGGSILTLQDVSASSADSGIQDTVGGQYGLLYEANGDGTYGKGAGAGVYGLVFYQAGIVVVTGSIFSSSAQFFSKSHSDGGGYYEFADSFVSQSISGNCDALRHRLYNLSFNNTTEINSTIYFCRVPHNKYNYSSNPTYTSGSKIQVKNVASDNPVSYITTIGLYSSNNELLATAKLSEPLRKDPTNDITLRVRLDY
tara:strand:+ start:879 stop:1982 length:1104 start_codon:yes stop_codon:yes gene_type:complete